MSWYDLSIPYPTAKTEHDAFRKTAELAVELGYTTLALNHTVIGKSAANAPNPIRKLELPANVRQLTRLTMVLEDHQQNHGMNVSNLPYDILAVRPMTEKTLQLACGTLDVDIISLDMSTRMPFFLKHTTVGLAVERGIHFEITYAAAIRDQTARRQLISNATNLVRVTRGKNIIISSEAMRAIELRAPYDLINLATLFGMSQEIGKDALTTHCRALLLHSETRRTTQKGAISVETIQSVKPNTSRKAGKKNDDGDS